MLVKTQGNWTPNGHAYFLATDPSLLAEAGKLHDYFLIAVNEISGENHYEILDEFIDNGGNLLIDSGIYTLAMDHARKHDVSHDQALNLAPEEVDGFDKLFDRYLEITNRFGDRCWGYIELDLGGRENKIKTREKLENQYGLRPMPVYHPFGDGWDYFDQLAQKYDRICFGNVVQASRFERKRLVATAWERHRRYPDLWIHLLGLTPNEWLYALPINSGDSSSWLSSRRWSGYKPKACGVSFGEMPKNYQYQLGSDASSSVGAMKSSNMAALGSYMMQKSWQHILEQYKNLGFELYPEPKGEER